MSFFSLYLIFLLSYFLCNKSYIYLAVEHDNRPLWHQSLGQNDPSLFYLNCFFLLVRAIYCHFILTVLSPRQSHLLLFFSFLTMVAKTMPHAA
jgi:hypothetical protein